MVIYLFIIFYLASNYSNVRDWEYNAGRGGVVSGLLVRLEGGRVMT